MAKKTNTIAISINELTYQREKRTMIFEDLSVSIEAHTYTMFKGPSGIGKTTLLRLIAGLETAQKGEITLFGKVASAPNILLPPSERSIGMLFQDLALWPHMTGKEQLEFVWKAQHPTEELHDRLDEISQDIGLSSEIIGRYPHQLSRGQQQRIAIARAVIHKPRVLLLDEPLTALDQELRTQFANFLKKLMRQQETTIVMVSHDLLPNILTPTRIFNLREGKLIEE